MDLGSFGAALRELDDDREPDTFVFCGEEFAVVDRIPSMLMLQLGASVTGKVPEAEGLTAMWEALRCSLTVPARGDAPADGSGFDRFYKLAVERRAYIEDIMKLTFALFEAEAGRPTGRPADSHVGPSSTSPSSSPSSIHPALVGMKRVDEVLTG